MSHRFLHTPSNETFPLRAFTTPTWVFWFISFGTGLKPESFKWQKPENSKNRGEGVRKKELGGEKTKRRSRCSSTLRAGAAEPLGRVCAVSLGGKKRMKGTPTERNRGGGGGLGRA